MRMNFPKENKLEKCLCGVCEKVSSGISNCYCNICEYNLSCKSDDCKYLTRNDKSQIKKYGRKIE